MQKEKIEEDMARNRPRAEHLSWAVVTLVANSTCYIFKLGEHLAYVYIREEHLRDCNLVGA